MYGNPGKDLVRLCSEADQIFISAPYIKADALGKILQDVNPNASLVCISRWSVEDLQLGSSDIECYAIVKTFGGSFRLHPTLHAKYYRMDDVVLVGSANLTFSGMGWSNHPNLEILCRPNKQFEADNFQAKLLADSREIYHEEVSRWKTLVEIESQFENTNAIPRSQLADWRPSTREPRNLELAYVGKENEIASYDEQQAAKQDLQKLSLPTGLNRDQSRAWISICLMESLFALSVIQLQKSSPNESYRKLAQMYDLETYKARRDFETVQNWLAFFTPEIQSQHNP